MNRGDVQIPKLCFAPLFSCIKGSASRMTSPVSDDVRLVIVFHHGIELLEAALVAARDAVAFARRERGSRVTSLIMLNGVSNHTAAAAAVVETKLWDPMPIKLIRNEARHAMSSGHLSRDWNLALVRACKATEDQTHTTQVKLANCDAWHQLSILVLHPHRAYRQLVVSAHPNARLWSSCTTTVCYGHRFSCARLSSTAQGTLLRMGEATSCIRTHRRR